MTVTPGLKVRITFVHFLNPHLTLVGGCRNVMLHMLQGGGRYPMNATTSLINSVSDNFFKFISYNFQSFQ